MRKQIKRDNKNWILTSGKRHKNKFYNEENLRTSREYKLIKIQKEAKREKKKSEFNKGEKGIETNSEEK